MAVPVVTPETGEAPITQHDDTPQTGEKGRSDRRALYRRVALWAGPIVIVAGALWMYLHGGRYVYEENAYVRAASVEIAPEIGGRVTQIAVTDNHAAKTGAPLFKVDPEPYQIALNAAQANLAATRNKLQGLIDTYKARSADISQAQASVDFAQSEFDRIKRLQQDGTVAQSALDAAHRDLLVAQSQLSSLKEAARSALAELGGNIDLPIEKHAEYLQAQSAVAKAQRDLRLTELTAPIDGIVTKSDAIQIGAMLEPGQSAFYLVSNTNLWIEANLKETELAHVEPGDSVNVVVDAYPQQTLRATVDSISPASGAVFSLLPPQNASGNWVKVVQRIPVKLRLEDRPDGFQLIDGMSVRVEIDTEYRRSLGTLLTDFRRLVRL